MSGGPVCGCEERQEPLGTSTNANRPPRLWRIIQYRCNYSAFNGGHYTPSDYSSITCLRCGAIWRTKADYVRMLSPRAEDEKEISAGYPAHRAEMEKRGRTPLRSSITWVGTASWAGP